MDKFSVIIVAGGTGRRMMTTESKQYLSLRNKPVIVHTIERFHEIEEAEDIILVVGQDDHERCAHYIKQYQLNKVNHIITGGSERQHSVYEGLQAITPGTKWVLVHDGVRPFVSKEDIYNCWYSATVHQAAVLAVPVKETIKVADRSRQVVSTPDRQSLWAVQTPQAFQCSLLNEAHERARSAGYTGTDDASLVERLGHPVQLVEGHYENIKLTTPDDLLWAEWILERKGE